MTARAEAPAEPEAKTEEEPVEDTAAAEALAEAMGIENLELRIAQALVAFGCKTRDDVLGLAEETSGTLWEVPGLGEGDIAVVRQILENVSG